MNNHCQFCRIESFKHQIICQNKNFHIIHSRSPLTKGHVMIVTKKHIDSFLDLTELEIKDFFKILKKISKSLKKTYKYDGINLFTNVGETAGQIIPHLHFHLILRFKDEKESPFNKLNNSKPHEIHKRLTREEIISRIKNIKENL
ncbi:HIT family protein [candidate division KSB1 bacterium]|nr:HIT family protein [candidate division KSB1 bacterium]